MLRLTRLDFSTGAYVSWLNSHFICDVIPRCRCAELNEKQRAMEEQEVQLTSARVERNGPLQVATEYDVMMCNAWQDAKGALDQYSDWKVKEKDKFEILTSTLMVRCRKICAITPLNCQLFLVAGVLPSCTGSARQS